METLMQAIKDSYFLRFLVALSLTVVVCYMVLTNQPVPELIMTVWLFTLGYGVGILNEKAMNTPVSSTDIKREDR